MQLAHHNRRKSTRIRNDCVSPVDKDTLAMSACVFHHMYYKLSDACLNGYSLLVVAKEPPWRDTAPNSLVSILQQYLFTVAGILIYC